MSKQTIKQQARRAALDAQSKRRAERAERERRVEGLAVEVLVAIRERDQAVTDAEHRAGVALTALVEQEGLTPREAAQWCGDEVTTRDIARLRRLVKAGERGAAATAGGSPAT